MRQWIEIYHPGARELAQFFSQLLDKELQIREDPLALSLPLSRDCAWVFFSVAENKASRNITFSLQLVGNGFESFAELEQKIEFLRYKSQDFASLFQLQAHRKEKSITMRLGKNLEFQLS